MTPNQEKEEISKAYLHAVAAHCGYTIGTWSQDQGCIDATIGAVGFLGQGLIEDPKLDVQLKATSRDGVEQEDHLAFPLEKPHYNKLKSGNRASPILLVVLLLPDDENEWVTHNADSLVLRRCAFWRNLKGEPDVSTNTKVVYIPKTQPFSPEQLRAIMTKISGGKEP